jgi:hypothetical protein
MRPRSSHLKPHKSQLRPDGTTFPPVTPDPPPPPGWLDPLGDLERHSQSTWPEDGQSDDALRAEQPRSPAGRGTRGE